MKITLRTTLLIHHLHRSSSWKYGEDTMNNWSRNETGYWSRNGSQDGQVYACSLHNSSGFQSFSSSCFGLGRTLAVQ